MRHEHLLRLYPPAWRARYGDEFLETLGPGALHPQQVIDIVSGAIDAWLSTDVRRATAVPGVSQTGGGSMTLKMLCERPRYRATVNDALAAAVVLIVGTWLLKAAATTVLRAGWLATGDAIGKFGFLAALTLSMPLWITKGQPWKAQAAIVGITLVFLGMIAALP